MYARPLCLIDHGGSTPFYIYIYKKCSGMQGLCDQFTRGVHLPSIYKYIYI